MDLESVNNLLDELLNIDREDRTLSYVIPFTVEAQSILDRVNDERKLLKDPRINSHH